MTYDKASVLVSYMHHTIDMASTTTMSGVSHRWKHSAYLLVVGGILNLHGHKNTWSECLHVTKNNIAMCVISLS